MSDINIVFTRVDNRLVHGQVGNVWVTASGANLILVVDDETCNDELSKSEGKHILHEVHVYVDDQDEACLKRLKEKGVDVYIQITPNDRKYKI